MDCSEKEIVEILDELEHIDNELFFDKLEQYLENHSS
nr:hypothetical protein [Enterococcus italicus]